jgi:hypothetical protein
MMTRDGETARILRHSSERGVMSLLEREHHLVAEGGSSSSETEQLVTDYWGFMEECGQASQ